MSEYEMTTEEQVAPARRRAGRVDGSPLGPVRDLAARLAAHFNPEVTDPAQHAVVSSLAADGKLEQRVLTYAEIAEAALPLLADRIPVGVGTDGSLRRQTAPSGPVGTGTDGSC